MPYPDSIYNRTAAVQYAKKYAMVPNPAYPYYHGDDCTNFVSQCLQAGGCKNNFNTTHPWWCLGNRTSICWSVAHSLYWYIAVSTKENRNGIKAKTYIIEGNDRYSPEIANILQLGDLIQYINSRDKIQHTAIITGFVQIDGMKQPLISQHTYEALNIPWAKAHKKTIFHHIIEIN
ncbi:MAG: amidase domain-containing protein [Vallitaleaceae bacterium]|nr:amidase domain-containing protein [Vallitaleaceae bacterium]